jgi:hypothetical protein
MAMSGIPQSQGADCLLPKNPSRSPENNSSLNDTYVLAFDHRNNFDSQTGAHSRALAEATKKMSLLLLIAVPLPCLQTIHQISFRTNGPQILEQCS